MPKSNKQDFTDRQLTGEVAVFGRTNTQPRPNDFAQYRSEVPSKTVGTVRSPVVKLTDHSNMKSVKRSPIVVDWWQNVPCFELFASVTKIAKAIETVAFNYQRTHQDSWFQQYPQLIIHSPNELQSIQQNGEYSTSWYRTNYRVLAKRCAHRVYYYINFSSLSIAALVNMLNMTRLNGQEPFKTLATAFRWSRINSITAYYARFPKLAGMEDWIMRNNNFAVGTTTYGAEIIGFPLWVTDVFGNRGSHSMDLGGLVAQSTQKIIDDYDKDTSDRVGTYATAAELDPQAANSFEQVALNQLIRNCSRISEAYSINNEGFWSPRIENGSTLFYSTGAGNGASRLIKGNTDAHTSVPVKSSHPIPNGDWPQADSFINAIWCSYHSLNEIMYSHFTDFTDVNSDWYQIFVRDLKILETSSKPEDLLKVVRDAPSVDIASIAKKMQFKKDNHCTTATTVRWNLPVVKSGDEFQLMSGFDWAADQSNFEENFERIPTDSTNPFDIIRASKSWPSNTPTVFVRGGQTVDYDIDTGVGDYTLPPIIVNGPVTAGPYLHDTESSESMVGKNQVNFDLICSNNFFPEASFIDGLQYDTQSIIDFVTACESYTLEEDPAQPRKFVTDIIDCSDIYQCGFNVLFSNEDKIGNELTDFFRDDSNYTDLASTYYNITISMFSNTDAPNGPSYEDQLAQGATDWPAQHIANDLYMDFVGHTHLFVGGMVFNHPILSYCDKNSGYYYGWLGIESNDADRKVTGAYIRALFANLHAGVTNPGDDGRTRLTRMLMYAGATFIYVDSNQQVISSSSALLCDILFNQIATSGSDISRSKFRNFIFDPSYGPINPLMAFEDVPHRNIKIGVPTGTTPDGALSQMMAINTESYDARISSNDPDGTKLTSQADREPLSGSSLIPMFTNIPNVTRFGGKLAYITSLNSARVVDRKPFVVEVGGLNRWMSTLLAQTRISFPGIEDMDNFWNMISNCAVTTNGQEDINAERASAIPTIDVITEPKVSPRSKEAVRDYNHYYGKPREFHSVAGDVVNNLGMRSNSDGSKGEKGYKSKFKPKNRSDRKAYKGSWSNHKSTQTDSRGDEVKPGKGLESFDDNINIMNSKGEGAFDGSTPLDTKVFDKKKERKIDPVSIQ